MRRFLGSLSPLRWGVAAAIVAGELLVFAQAAPSEKGARLLPSPTANVLRKFRARKAAWPPLTVTLSFFRGSSDAEPLAVEKVVVPVRLKENAVEFDLGAALAERLKHHSLEEWVEVGIVGRDAGPRLQLRDLGALAKFSPAVVEAKQAQGPAANVADIEKSVPGPVLIQKGFTSFAAPNVLGCATAPMYSVPAGMRLIIERFIFSWTAVESDSSKNRWSSEIQVSGLGPQLRFGGILSSDSACFVEISSAVRTDNNVTFYVGPGESVAAEGCSLTLQYSETNPCYVPNVSTTGGSYVLTIIGRLEKVQ